MDNKVITLLNDMVMSCDNENKDIYKDLIDKCDKLKQLCEDIKNNCTSVELLKLKYCNKYLYFEGYEGGSQIAYIKNMRYKNNKDFVWDGYLIRLDLFNANVTGVKLQEVEGYSFEDMPYFQNAYGFEPNDFERIFSIPASSNTERTAPPAIIPVPCEAGLSITAPAPDLPVIG